ncbi:MAG: phosphatase PAP2 family protein [Gemmatimonadota bacterium]|nr:phosphatase PAP2 family protein [Gemmatimonadota bacterium]
MYEPNSGSALGGYPHQHDIVIHRALTILAVYLTAMVFPMARWTLESGSLTGLVSHLIVLAIVWCALTRRLPTAARDWTPLAVGPFLYIELRWLIAGARRAHEDRLVAGWERVLFATEPSRVLATRWHWAALSEVLHAAYLSYYAIVLVPPAVLWLRGRRCAFSSTLLALTVVYAICFTIYVIFPVDGPRFLNGASAAPPGPIRTIVLALLVSGSSRGTAFPSSHVAASVVATVCALRFQRPVGVVLALLTVGVCVGAVYGGYHYGVDIVAGLLTGAVALALAYVIERRAYQADET